MSSRPRVTVAIDLGSTFCGYAYSIDDGSIKLNSPWSPESGQPHSKTPTALLYDEGGAFEHFGFQATSNLNPRRNNYFRFFKKSSHETQTFNLASMFTNQSGVEKITLQLYADVLRKLKDHCLGKLQESEFAELPQLHEILWILPVPIIWQVHEREFMVAAAMQAGLITEMKATNLMIILEGDATFAFCQELDPLHDIVRRVTDGKARRLTEYDGGVLVLDAGGKTVDATTKWNQPIAEGGDFIPNEKLHPSGFSAGGESINWAFEERLGQILDRQFIRYMKENKLALWMMFMTEFEVKKKEFSRDNECIVLSDVCVTQLSIAYENWSASQSYARSLADALDEDNSGLFLDGLGRLRLPRTFVMELFHETVRSITDFVDAQLRERENNKPIVAIYLAGGFASSPYLQEKVKQVVNRRADVIIPIHPEQGVLRGAIHYSRAHQCISTWKIDANYGVMTKALQREADATLHPHLLEKGKTVIKGNTYQTTVYRDDLVQDDCVSIYRNEKEVLTFPLVAQPNIRRYHRPSVKIFLQVGHSKSRNDILQATVIDETNQMCYIKRMRTPIDPVQFMKEYPIIFSILAVFLACIVGMWIGYAASRNNAPMYNRRY